MDDSFYIHVKRGRDGGLAITEVGETSDQALVFAGNVKDATDYFGKRAAELASNSPEVNKTPFDAMPKPRVVTSPRSLADRLIERDVDHHYADASGQ